MIRKIAGICGVLAGTGMFLFGLGGAAVRWAVWNARNVPGTRASMVTTTDHIIGVFIILGIIVIGVVIGIIGGRILRGATNTAPHGMLANTRPWVTMQQERDFGRTALWAVVIPFVTILLFRFLIGPLFIKESKVAFLGNELGFYFVLFLLVLVVTLVIDAGLRSSRTKKKSSEQSAPPLCETRGGSREGEP